MVYWLMSRFMLRGVMWRRISCSSIVIVVMSPWRGSSSQYSIICIVALSTHKTWKRLVHLITQPHGPLGNVVLSLFSCRADPHYDRIPIGVSRSCADRASIGSLDIRDFSHHIMGRTIMQRFASITCFSCKPWPH